MGQRMLLQQFFLPGGGQHADGCAPPLLVHGVEAGDKEEGVKVRE